MSHIFHDRREGSSEKCPNCGGPVSMHHEPGSSDYPSQDYKRCERCGEPAEESD